MQKACNVMNLGSSVDARPQVVASKQNLTNELLYQATNTNFALTLFLEQIYKQIPPSYKLHYALCENEEKKRIEIGWRNYELLYMTTR